MKAFRLQKVLSVILASGICIMSPGIAEAAIQLNVEKGIPVLQLEDQFGMIEAEECYVDGDYVLKEDAGASGGKYLQPSISGLNNDGDGRAAQRGGDDIRLYIDVTEEAYYTIWVRCRYSNGTTDGNYWINLDGVREMKHFDNCENYIWNSVRTTKLSAGKHVFGIQPRRSNVAIDKFLITSSETYAPTETGEKPPEFRLGKEGESMKNLYYPLPAYTPPAEHPRLFLRQADIPRIIENFTNEQNEKAWAEVQKTAAKNMDCSVKSDVAYSYSPEVHNYVECCAFLYAIDKENNRAYGYKAINGLYDYLSTMSYSGDGIQLARSGVIQYIAKVYDWCHDLLTDEEKEFFIKKGLALATKLECGWPSTKLSAFNSDHGSEGSVQVDMMSLAIATYEDYPDIWNVAAGRFFSEYVPINNFYYEQSSWQAEGDSYGKSRYGYEAKANAILDKLGWGSLVSKKEHYLGYNQIYRRRPDGNFMMDGDIWDITFSTSLGSCYAGDKGSLLSLSYRYQDPYLKYELYKQVQDGLENGGRDATMSLCDFLILNDVSVPLKSNKDLPLTMYTGEGHNMMTARTGWEDGLDSNTMVVSMKGGGRTRGGHMHLDAGNFTIYYKGPLALDSGVYNGLPFVDENGVEVTKTQAGSYHFANYLQRTIAHNCMLVYDPNEVMKYHNLGELNDGGQIKGRYNTGDQRTYEAATGDDKINSKRLGVDYGPDMNKPAYSYLKTDITNAYSEKMKEYTRTFLFQNFFDDAYPGALIVFDKVKSSDPSFKKTWLLHSQEEPQVDGTIATIKRTEYGYNGRMVNETLLPQKEDVSIEKIGGEGKEYMVGDVNVKAVNITKGDESGKWRIEVSPKTEKETDYFLNVLQVSDNDETIPPLTSEYYESGNYVGVKIKDRVTWLTKLSGRTSKGTAVYAEGTQNEKLQFTVDGLNTGRWNVLDENSQIIASCDVTKEGGIAYFEAAPGAYILQKARGFNNIASKNFDILSALSEQEYPLEIKLAYNTMYQYLEKEEPIKEMDGRAYLPFRKLLSVMDNESTYSEDGEQVHITFEDNQYDFTIGGNAVTKHFAYLEKTEEKSISYPLIRENGIVYAPMEMMSELFEKKASYDRIGKIVWLKNAFQRAKDNIVNSSDPSRITVKDAYGTDLYESYPAHKALDGDVGTTAGTNVIGGTLTYEFKESYPLNRISVLWNQGTTRDYGYEFYVSEDGDNFTKVLEGQTGYTADYTDYTIPTVNAKYFRIVAKGNTLNNWFVIKEIRFYKED